MGAELPNWETLWAWGTQLLTSGSGSAWRSGHLQGGRNVCVKADNVVVLSQDGGAVALLQHYLGVEMVLEGATLLR